MRLALCLLLATPCFAQAFTVSMSLEPLEVFRAVFQSHISRLALYEVVACAGPAEVTLSGGKIIQIAHSKGVQTIDKRLLSVAIATGRRKSKLYKAYKTAYYLGMAGATVAAGSTWAIPKGVNLAMILTAQTAGELKGAMEQRDEMTAMLIPGFLDVGDQISLPANGCASRLVMGTFDRGFRPFVVNVDRAAANGDSR